MPDGLRVRDCGKDRALMPPADALRRLRIIGQQEDGAALVSRTGPEGSARLLPLADADGLLRVPAAVATAARGAGFTMLPLSGVA